MNTTIEEVVDTEPLKLNLEHLVDRSDFSRKVFFFILKVFMLRTWYIRRELNRWAKGKEEQPMHILDAGSGYGQNSFILSSICPRWTIMGMDLKSSQVSGCNHFFQHEGRQNVSFRHRDLTQLKQEDSFDLILSVETLTYIEEDDLVLDNFHKALKPGGELLVWVPVCNKSKKIPGCDSLDQPHRVRNGYNVERLQKKLSQHGFSKIHSQQVFGQYGSWSKKLSATIPTHLLSKYKLFSFLLPLYYFIVLPFCLLLNLADYRRTDPNGSYAILRAYK